MTLRMENKSKLDAQRQQMMTDDYYGWIFLDASGSKQHTLDLGIAA